MLVDVIAYSAYSAIDFCLGVEPSLQSSIPAVTIAKPQIAPAVVGGPSGRVQACANRTCLHDNKSGMGCSHIMVKDNY